jgi:predicted  nucleic acid-binding Zn-ribbon protein
MDNNFIDLRLNHRVVQAEDSFWPSFTDIMTVIVMIFLLAMVILLMRNMELVNQLRATMEAERQAMELARTTGAENETLEEQLIARENELSMMRMQLMRMEEQSEQQEAAITSQQHQISTLSREREDLKHRVERLTAQRSDLNQRIERLTVDSTRLQNQVAEANRTIRNLNQDLSQLQAQQENTLKDLETLQRSYTSQSEALETALAQNLESNQALLKLETDYKSLKIKYDKLVRPARSPRGKTVVEVRYYKTGNDYQIDYRGPGEADFTTATRPQLDDYLTTMKRKYPEGLYIKVILPKDSGLSYSDAWSFTNYLHKTYDYYYQEAAQKERMIDQ